MRSRIGKREVLKPDPIGLTEMNELPCVALLGEPGIGKTWDLARQYEEIRPKVIESGARFLKVDLRSYADESQSHALSFRE